MTANTIQRLTLKWYRRNIWSLSVALLGAFLFISAAHRYLDFSLSFTITALIMAIALTIWFIKSTKPTHADAVQLANQQNAPLEYSASLLLSETHSPLASIQRTKVQETLAQYDYRLPSIIRELSWIMGVGILSFMMAAVLYYIRVDHTSDTPYRTSDYGLIADTSAMQIGQINISLQSIKIAAPAYTRIGHEITDNPNLTIPKGAEVRWNFNIIGQPQTSFFLLSDGDTIQIKDGRYGRRFLNKENYRYGIVDQVNSQVSDYYAIDIIDDAYPITEIAEIEEYVKLPWKDNHDIYFTIDIRDDYGIENAKIIATVAKGQGESVKFREKEIALRGFKTGMVHYQGEHTFSTSTLEMEPGDELYFYIQAKDNCPYEGQWTKSPTYFITITDTTTYEYVDDASMQVDLMPDFFRSQRQIIIDSEHLLSIKEVISQDSFNQMSNELGFDQKLLRLKYGQFLGEESESGIAIQNEIETEHQEHDHEGHDHDHDNDHDHERHNHGTEKSVLSEARDLLQGFMHDHDHEEEEGLLMATKGTQREEASKPSWVQELSHTHDNVEEASFHNMSVKSKLRAAMSTMWDAELHLRLFDPQTSLPFQYESLELLQEIKNHARIYVHRIGFDPPVIKEQEQRLSGELDELHDSSWQSEKTEDDPYHIIETTIDLLGQPLPTASKIQQLSIAQSTISQLALSNLTLLPVLSELQTAMTATVIDFELIKRALIKILPSDNDHIKSPDINSHQLTKSVAKSFGVR